MSQDFQDKEDTIRIDVLTIFPQLISNYCDEAILGRARRSGRLDLRTHDLRDGATDRHRSVDDTTFGGGPGMVMRCEPIYNVVERVKPIRPLFVLTPGGRRFDHLVAHELAESEGFSLLCGRYEGIDQRVIDDLCDGELSIGDFVLGGGELAALAIIEAVTRLVPGVMGNTASAESESFGGGLLEYPQYTRPAEFRGMRVPDVLQSGDHAKIERWRRAQAMLRTRSMRPDLLQGRGEPSAADDALFQEFEEIEEFKEPRKFDACAGEALSGDYNTMPHLNSDTVLRTKTDESDRPN